MPKKTRIIGVLLLSLSLSACLSDAIFDFGSGPETSPYLVLILDYRATALASTACNGIDNCAEAMSAEVFIPFCQNQAGGSESDCTAFYGDLQDDGAINNSNTATYTGYDTIPDSFRANIYDVFIETFAAVAGDYDFPIALMAPNKQDGGTVLQGFRLLEPTNVARENLKARLDSIPEALSGAYDHPLQLKETLYELYRYLNGGDYINLKHTAGNFTATAEPRNEGIADYDGCVIAGAACDSSTGAVTGGTDNGKYRFPLEADQACTQLYAMVMAANVTNLDNDLDSEIATDMGSAAATDSEPTTLLSWFADSDYDVVNHVLAPGKQQLKTWIIADQYREHLLAWAAAGGTGDTPLYLQNFRQFETDLRHAFNRMLRDNRDCQTNQTEVSPGGWGLYE